MPELPLVEHYRQKLRERILGHKIVWTHLEEDPIVIPDVNPTDGVKRITGKRVVDLQRRGKYLWWVLEADSGKAPNEAAIFHFGMTGSFKFRSHDEGQLLISNPADRKKILELEKVSAKKESSSADENLDNEMGEDFSESLESTDWPPRFSKMLCRFDDDTELAFINIRRLGRLFLTQEDPTTFGPIAKLGFDPLLNMPSQTEFLVLVRRRKTPIKALLLNQAFSAGIGNWVADEVLYQARIHPHAIASELTDEEVEAIHKSILHVCTVATEFNCAGRRFPDSWLYHYRWNKGKETAYVDGRPIEFIEAGGRSTAFVPELQKLTKRSASSRTQSESRKRNREKDHSSEDGEHIARKSSRLSKKKDTKVENSPDNTKVELNDSKSVKEKKSKNPPKKRARIRH